MVFEGKSLLPSKYKRKKGVSMFEEFELEALKKGFSCPVGIDEVGRGPLAGPVVAAACYLPQGIEMPGINDSKKLTAREREVLVKKVLQHPEIHFAMGSVASQEIDRLNILEATFVAMNEAVSKLDISPDFLLIDGNRAPKTSIPYLTVIRGDARVKSIALASVIAKYHRDEMMREYHKEYPEYGFDVHKGYATEMHLKAIQKYGPSPIHRMSFSPLKDLFHYKEISVFSEME